MQSLLFREMDLDFEIKRILDFIIEEAGNQKLLIGVSGGMDSDVTARLCQRAVGSERLKLFTVLQAEFDEKYIENAETLANDLECELVKITMSQYPFELMDILAKADPEVGFFSNPDYLDVGRSKCALRTFIFSAYAERGYLVVGPSNRTELELGYFLPFGDQLSHFSPIVHLYKTQVFQIAKLVGTRQEVISQPPAAGFWIGDSDLRGIAYWLFNEGPIQIDLDLSQESKRVIDDIHSELNFESIDIALSCINQNLNCNEISALSGLSVHTCKLFEKLAKRAFFYKRRKLCSNLLKSS